jgi:GNAT superfamily N-acetyltransferase
VLSDDARTVDWRALNAALAADDFDNGRSDDELRRSFENSAVCVFALADGAVIGKARALSDGVCNAWVVDVWTRSDWRLRGVGRSMLAFLEARLDGQHVALFTADSAEFYANCGYREQPVCMSKVVGRWLRRGHARG